MAELKSGTNVINSAKFGFQGDRVIIASGLRAQAWDLSTKVPVGHAFPLGGKYGRALTSPDGSRIFLHGAGAHDSQLRSTATAEVIGSNKLHSGFVGWAEFSRAGEKFVTASADNTAAVWETATGRQICSLPHGAWVSCARFSTNGRLVVTAGRDDTAKIWDADTGRLLTPPMLHSHDVIWAEFSPDGSRMVTVAKDRTARVWDVESGLPLTRPLPQDGEVLTASFDRTGEQILTAAKETAAHIWFVPRAREPAPSWLAELAEAVGGRRLGKGHELETVPLAEVLRLRERLTEEAGDDFYSRWVRWFFADRASRPSAFGRE
jgi:WD40 repeat protein